MSAKQRDMLHMLRVVLILGFWTALALLVTGTALAQGDGGTAPPNTSTLTGDPQNLDEVAVRLAPLLVGAALIERTLEFLFNWVERAILDASHYLHGFAARVTGLVRVDFREAWSNLDELTNAILRRRASPQEAFEGDANSTNPDDWPLAMLESRLNQAQQTLATAEKVLQDAMSSPEYVARKKMAAAWMSIACGLALAFTSNLRLFKPLGVDVADWFQDPYEVIDLVLAGVLMGLGTEYIHQVIGLLIKGKGLLGRAAGGQGGGTAQFDPEQVRLLAEAAVGQAFNEQFAKLRQDLEQQVEQQIDRRASPPH